MTEATATRVLRGGHVIDPATGLDRIVDITLQDGKIAAVGDGPAPAGAEIVDLAGHYVTPGWVDLHVHAYGTLGFADPDSIGIYQGVTTFVEAGGPGIGTLDEFVALMEGRTITALYAGPYLRPMGIVGLNFIEGDIRSLTGIPIAEWMDFMKAHPGLLRYLKIGAFGSYGKGPLKMGKGLAETLGLPLYVHIGEHQQQKGDDASYEIFRIAEAGDIITHLYHNNRTGVLDRDGKVLPLVKEAEKRGVLFDIGFGGYNFAWSVAEKAYAQDLVPHIISSDLQQFNVIGPTFSLANVMSIFLRLGMSLNDVIARVTTAPAKALKLDDRAGSLKVGLPADVTVFRIEEGAFELADTYNSSRTADRRIMPVMAFKGGRRIDSDMTRCQDERNWLVQIAETHVPAAAERLTPAQLAFLAALRGAIAGIQWDASSVENFDLWKAIALQDAFHAVRRAQDLALKPALTAVFDCFLDHPFTMQIGLFLLRLDRTLALARLEQVTAQRRKVA
ncbi:MAG TPA: amidohydrolase/deacetylase family metallohydrolase [Alphaproteobacteria bacterium]|nr:amidohydrolase/deacetylase family metallohydrolase [Alphaproteobacteria bacterium]